jgi:hypothetical protein
MTDKLQKQDIFEIAGRNYLISFTVDVDESSYLESYEHFGNRGSRKQNNIEFELDQITNIQDPESEEKIEIRKELEKEARKLLHEWIWENEEEMAGELDS